MGELALRVWPGALVALKLSADLQLQPSRVLTVEQIVHVDHSHGQRQGSVGRGSGDQGGGRSAGNGDYLTRA